MGISISVPIFNNRSARTARNKARLQTAQAQLSYQSAEKELLSTVESLRQDMVGLRYLVESDSPIVLVLPGQEALFYGTGPLA